MKEKTAKAEQKNTLKGEKRNEKESVVPETPLVTSSTEIQNMEMPEPSSALEAIAPRSTKPSYPTDLEKGHESTIAEVPHQTKSVAPVSYEAPAQLRTSMEMQTEERLNQIIKEGESSPTSPGSSRGVKGWFKNKLSRRQSKPPKSEEKEDEKDSDVATGVVPLEANESNIEARAKITNEDIPTNRSSNDETPHENSVPEERAGRSQRRKSSVSSVSALSGMNQQKNENSKNIDAEDVEGQVEEVLHNLPSTAVTKSESPVRDSKFHEIM